MTGSDKNTRALVGLVIVLALAGAFWILLLSPKHKEADELKEQVVSLEEGLGTVRVQAVEARTAKKAFPAEYRQMVLIGKAVPEGSETPSLLVALTRIARRSKTEFESLALGSAETETIGTGTSSTAAQAGPTSEPTQPVPPTEAEAALLPLGATIGAANFGAMPYSLTFTGRFFQIADFIEEIEKQIRTGKAKLFVEGRLITIDGFSLVGLEKGSSDLKAEFSVTTYLVPPSAETSATPITAGATAPEFGGIQESPAAAGEAATGTPSSFSTGEAR